MAIGGQGEREKCRHKGNPRKTPVSGPPRRQPNPADQDPGHRPQRQRLEPGSGSAARLPRSHGQFKSASPQSGRPFMKRCVALTLVPVLAVTGCIQPPVEPVLEPLPPVTGEGAVAPPRVNGSVGTLTANTPVLTSTAAPADLAAPFGRRHYKPRARSPSTSRTPTYARSRRRSSATSCTSTTRSIRRCTEQPHCIRQRP